ncbi:hemicentin-1-like [Clytia hemisphaerica]|uniref:hemicentin-1-like n=1 Tax=Clytia hemisphaerica TaxID=252671 RepID=UPI0034D766E9
MLELLLVVLATVQLHFHDVLASPEIKVTDLWTQNFYNFTSDTVEILKGKDDASHKVPSLPIFIPYCTNLATEVYVCTNGVLGLNRNECPFKPQAYGAEISSQWPLIAPFYADLTFNDPSDGKPPPYLGYGVFTIGSTMNHVVKRAKDDVNNYLKTTDFEAIQVVVVTWFNARAPFGSNGEGVTFQSAIITDGMRSFVRFSYGNMQWTANKNVQVGYKFPSLRDNCKVSFNIPLSGHGNLKFPLDKIDGNIDSKGVWMFQISSLRSPIDEVNDLDVTIITFASTKLKFGEPIVLVCKISFYSSPVYKWYQNSQIVEGQNKQVFEKAADTESEGTYRCEISINGKSKKSENSLDLNVFYLLKPNIIVKPSTNLVQSESLLLSCDVQSSKQPMFVWFKDDKLLQATESYLYFHQVTNENAGKYHCKCRSSVNEVVSDEVNISVKGIKVPVVTSSHSGPIDEGTDVTLTCTSEVENIQLSWHTKTKGLVHTGAVYKMEKITSKQTDEYFCKSKLDSNEVSSNVIKIQVKYCRVPFLSAVPSNEVTLGSSIQLTCVIDAFPSIKKYIWHKNSVFLKNTTENSITALMNNVEDQGQYECVVSCSEKLEKAKLNVKTKYLGQAVLTIQPEGFKKRYTSILLICQATGYPTPSITWYHNNQKIEGETSKHLTISNAASQDEGEYYCNVENEVGRKTSEKKQVTLSYLDNPDITLSKSTLIEGESVTLTCSSQSFPQCTFKWKRNEQIISTNRQLIIKRLSQSSNGLYVCVVTNEVGYEEKAINIVVKYMTSPAVTLCPETSHLALGTNTTLNCNVHASNIDRIQWLKNEKVLALNSTKLSLKNISLNDEGNYRCVAYGASQSKTSQVIQLSIAYLKEVTISINNSQPKSHDTIKLTCVVKGFPRRFNFQWRKGGEVIPQAKGSVLILNDVSEKDSGFYECVVENEGGVATSGSTINVYALSIPTLKIEPGTTLKRGQFASLICSTHASSKDIEYTWYKDGRVLPWNGRENFLQSVDVNEQGEYKCSADDGRQKKISTVIQLTVIYLEKPSIVNTTATVVNGSTQYFKCDVNGTSPIQYRWMKDGKIIVSNRQLVLKEVRPDDGGQYTCIVKNEAGEETVDLQITVQYISKVELSIEPSATVNEGDTVLMFCKVKSPQPVIYLWYFEDNILQDNLQNKIINSVQLKNQGKYRCVAKHPMIGEKTSPSKEITINYLQPPMITITNTSITSTLNCSTRGSPHPSIRWIRNGVQVSSRAGHVINRKDYHKEITLLHCEVENAVAKLTSHVTEEKKYLSTPQLSRRPSGDVIEGQTILLFCQVDGSEPITYSWFHKDVLIAGNSSWYVLQNVSTSTNDGGYRCTASNDASTKSSKTLSIDVHYLRLPTIISTPTLRGSSSLLEGSSITLSCSTDGKPSPTVTWHFQNKQLTSLSTLTLSDLSPEQSGTYHCTVENNPLTHYSQIGIQITSEYCYLKFESCIIISYPNFDWIRLYKICHFLHISDREISVQVKTT